MSEDPWRTFFNEYADRYDDEPFTKNTEAEIGFILEHTNTPRDGTILDLGCGTGRHSVPLALHGFRVTGVDLSEGMLEVAKRRADHAGASVEFVRSDAAEFVRPDSFNTCVCLCEGAFCLLREGDDALRRDEVVLGNLAASLKPGGTLILNALSVLRAARALSDRDVESGRFDPTALTERSDAQRLIPGLTGVGELRERYYTAPELRRMAEHAGLTVRGVYGGTAGNWGLRPVTLDEYELMLIATK